MTFRGTQPFVFQCGTRLLLMTATLQLAAWAAYPSKLVATATVLALLALYQMVGLANYIFATARSLNRFLYSMAHKDFTAGFPTHGLPKDLHALQETFAAITNRMQQLAERDVMGLQFMEAVIEQVPMAFLVYHMDGEILVANKAARRICALEEESPCALDQLPKPLADLLSRGTLTEGELVRISLNDRLTQYSLHIGAMEMDRTYRLACLQNIGTVLEDIEIEAWHKLFRVLVHEIRNSITPISALAEMLEHSMQSFLDDRYCPKERRRFATAVSTIRKRSDAMMTFLERYRQLSGLTLARLETTSLKELLEEVKRIVSISAPNLRHIACRLNPPTLSINLDPKLITQVLMNLVKNAQESKEHPVEIQLEAALNPTGGAFIRVYDDGPGVPEEEKSQIFIPYYTTKPNGSGIGLSLSKQIMRLHGGHLQIVARKQGSCFELAFPEKLVATGTR